MKLARLIAAGGALVAVLFAPLPASATMLGVNAGVAITFSEGGPHVSSTNLPFNSNVIVGPGIEVAGLHVSDVYLSTNPPGFPQTMTGTVNVDIGADTIAVSFAGQGVPYTLDFVISNLPSIASLTLISQSGLIDGVNYFFAPTFTSDSVHFSFFFLGYQPGLNMSQTVRITESAPPVPEPASLLLIGTGLAGVAVRLRRRR